MKKFVWGVLAFFAFLTVLFAVNLMERVPQIEETPAPQAELRPTPEPSKSTETDVTLYFRYGQTALLGAQHATIDLGREETAAALIVRLLLAGPDQAHARLSSIFPQGTQLIAAQADDQTASITLSRAFFGRPEGAPANWEDSSAWQEEAALRRRLAVQSIVLALTEDGRCQRVQLYVADDDDAVPERIPLAALDPQESDPALRLAASARDETALVTPARALRALLSAWNQRDWAAAYAFVAQSTVEAPASESVFVRTLEEQGAHLLRYSVSEGSVSLDGQRATLVVDVTVQQADGATETRTARSVRLVREADNWCVPWEELLSLMDEE